MKRLSILCLTLVLPAIASAAVTAPDDPVQAAAPDAWMSTDGPAFAVGQGVLPADAPFDAGLGLMADASLAVAIDPTKAAAFAAHAPVGRTFGTAGTVGNTRGVIDPLVLPEPGSLALAGMALALLACNVRQRRA